MLHDLRAHRNLGLKYVYASVPRTGKDNHLQNRSQVGFTEN